MPPFSAAYGAYVNASEMVSKTRQVVMLYEGVVKFLQQARKAMDDGRIEERHQLLNKVLDIFSGLQNALDYEQGGDVAAMLYDFYEDLRHDLRHVEIANDKERCDRVIKNVKEMLDTWRQVDSKASASSVVAGKGTFEPEAMKAATAFSA